MMKLTEAKLKQLIKEGLDNTLKEAESVISSKEMVKQEMKKNPEFKKMLQTLLQISRSGDQRREAFMFFKALEGGPAGKDFIMGKDTGRAQTIRKTVLSVYKGKPVYKLIQSLFSITRKNNLRLDVAKKFVDLLDPLSDSELMTTNVRQSDPNDPLLAPNSLIEQEGKVTFTVDMGRMGGGIDINGMTTREFSKNFNEEGKSRIQALRTRVSELYSDMQGKMGSRPNPKERKRRVEEMAAAIASHDLGGAEFEVIYRQ